METIQTAAHKPAYLNSHSLIQTFPSELLLIIFKFAYVAARREEIPQSFPYSEDSCEGMCYCEDEPSYECGEYDDENLPPPALFPNAIASVCSRWGDLMLLVPVFWTRIVILLDSDTFSPSNLKRQLHSSGNNLLDIHVTRTSFSDAKGLKDVEQSRMGQTIMALRSHLQRCRALRITVVHSSSLPRLRAVLPPDAPDLRTLSLESHIDSGRPGVQPYRLLNRATAFNLCMMHTVVLDGWNFFDLQADDEKLDADSDIFSECRVLSLKFGEIPTASIGRLAERSRNLGYLDIDSVTFTQRYGLPRNDGLNTVTLRNLSVEAMELMLGFISNSIRYLAIDSCLLPPLQSRLCVLDLRNIGPDHGLRDFIGGWFGIGLKVTGCPEFDDEILKEMGGRGYNVMMDALFIEDCHGFSVGALKELINIRAKSRGWGRLKRLEVKKAGITLSMEDYMWFMQNVSSFMWKTSRKLRSRDI